MVRDLLLFVVFFVLQNAVLGLRRSVGDMYHLTSTLRQETVERRFLVTHLRDTPVIASDGSKVLNWTSFTEYVEPSGVWRGML